MNRREALKGFPLAAVAVSLPAVAHDTEPGTDKVERLARELSAAIEETYGGDWQVVVGSDGEVAYRWTGQSAEDRLKFAIAKLREAMAELGHEQWMAMIREESATHGGGFANALIFDGSGTCENQIKLA